jgi:hypothetical protein
MSAVVLLHGGEIARRTALAAAIRERLSVRVRTSSRAAEAAKALADPAMFAVLLLEEPADALALRASAAARGLAHRVYDVQARDDADVVVGMLRAMRG